MIGICRYVLICPTRNYETKARGCSYGQFPRISRTCGGVVSLALEAKCPKLAVARGGASESILVLESDDLAFGNYVDIAAGVIAGLEDRTDAPDVVCLVETDAGLDVWLVKERDAASRTCCRRAQCEIPGNFLICMTHPPERMAS